MQHLKVQLYPHFFLLIEPATFVKRLTDTSVETGSPIVLEATYTGTPPISVSWMKNEYALVQSPNCSITTTENSSILEILESSIEDYAQYACLIENEAGQDICEALVSVLGVLTVSPPPVVSSCVTSSLSWRELINCCPLCLRTALLYRTPGTRGSSNRGAHNITV